MYPVNFRRTAPAPPKPPGRVPAGLAILAPQFEEMELGGTVGEFLAQPAASAPPPPQPLVIEPWPEEERRRAAAQAVEPGPQVSALEAMMAGAVERGEIEELPNPFAPP